MNDDDISKAMDEIGLSLRGRGMSTEAIEEFLKREAERVANELEHEENDFSK